MDLANESLINSKSPETRSVNEKVPQVIDDDDHVKVEFDGAELSEFEGLISSNESESETSDSNSNDEEDLFGNENPLISINKQID